MKPYSLLHRSGLALVVCAGLLVATLPPGIARAAYVVPRLLGNTVPQFTNGTFQRSQLSSIKSDLPKKIKDQEGAVQLAPIGLFKFGSTSTSKSLPYNLVKMGVATVGTRIFVIGGVAFGPDASSPLIDPNDPESGRTKVYQSETVPRVWSANISVAPTSGNQVQGDITADGWVEELALNAMQSSDQPGLTGATNVLNAPAVTAVTVGGRSYIYAIGGNTRIGTSTQDFSAYTVRVATIGGNGRIASWVPLDGAKLPANPTSGIRGLQGASAVTMTFNGTAYVYLIGGLQRYQEDQNIKNSGSRKVYWAKVDSATGKLFKPSSPSEEGWDTMVSELRVDDPNNNAAGLWDAAAVAGQYQLNTVPAIPGDQPASNAIYVFGGQQSSAPANVFSSSVQQLYVSSEQLTPINGGYKVGEPYPGDWQDGTLPEARYALGAVTFGGKHYLTGGSLGNATGNLDPQRDMLTSYVQDDLTLPNFGGDGGANFLTDPAALASRRAYHGTAIVPLGDSAFVYVIGGQTNTPSSQAAYSNEILFGRVGDQKDTAVGFPSDGWYYGKPVEFNFKNAEVQEINWGALIDANTPMDVEFYYRTSLANDCANNPQWTVNDWKLVDGDPDARSSLNGDNTIPLTGVVARCFQYRARLVGNSSPGTLATASPSLLYVSLKILVPGSPDLRADQPNDVTVQINEKGQISALNVQIRNQNDDKTGNVPTLDANADQSGGSFFVDLYIYGPGETPVAPTIPISGGNPNDVGCASIDKDAMTVGSVRQITQWYSTAGQTDCKSTPVDLLTFFEQRGKGKYTVFVVVDSECGGSPWGCVDERDAPNGEGNNVRRLDFELTADGPVVDRTTRIRLPMIYNS